MTPREAHRWLEGKQRMMTQYRHLFSSEDVEANGMAILSLEKQIPKKPIYEDTDNIYGAMKRTCSNCGDVVMVSPQARPFELYCRYCGTRLVDWKEENE